MKVLFITLFGIFFFVSLFALIYGYDFKSIGEFYVYLTEKLPLSESKNLFDWLFGDLFNYVSDQNSKPSLMDEYGSWFEGIDFSRIWDSIVSLFTSSEPETGGGGGFGGGGFGAR